MIELSVNYESLGESKSDQALNQAHLAGHIGTQVHEPEAVHACFLIKQSCACSGVVAISSQIINWLLQGPLHYLA